MIPISKPSIAAREVEIVSNAVSTGWVSSLGEYIDCFEKRFADYCGTQYALTVANGTVGLHLALASLGIGPGDEVIIPDLTFVATANAVRMASATPVVVDVDPNSFCIAPEKITERISTRTKAIIPVHLYGHPCRMDLINQIADNNNLYVIEDAAEAHGASFGNSRVGSLGTCGVFSFYGNKIITTGEGGMITTNNSALYNRARYLRDHAMSQDKRYWHTDVGFNYRMTNMQAALGVAQLEQIDHFLNTRKHILASYSKRLSAYGVSLNPQIYGHPVNWLTCAVLPQLNRLKRDEIILSMKKQGIDTRPFFYPISALPMYRNKNSTNHNAYMLSDKGINLPTYPGLSESDIQLVCDAFLSSIDSTMV